jgi:hypothetical protein
MSHARVIVAIDGERKNDVEAALEWEMMPFDESGECFKDGSRWDWYQIGGRFSGQLDGADIVQVKNLKLDRMIETKRQRLIESYHEAAKEKHKGARMLVYDVDPDEITLESWLESRVDGIKFPASYAFLRNRHWHEGERMGWFGVSAATECEIAAKKSENSSIEEMIRRCKYRDPETDASVVCWNEPWEIWNREFYHRFIEPLSPETVLVNVDYHV